KAAHAGGDNETRAAAQAEARAKAETLPWKRRARPRLGGGAQLPIDRIRQIVVGALIRKQVSVDVHRDLDTRVAQKALDLLWRGTGGNQGRRGEVAAVVRRVIWLPDQHLSLRLLSPALRQPLAAERAHGFDLLGKTSRTQDWLPHVLCKIRIELRRARACRE